MDLITVLPYILTIASGISEIALPIFCIKIFIDAGKFFTYRRKEAYESAKYYTKKAKIFFRCVICALIYCLIYLMICGFDTNTLELAMAIAAAVEIVLALITFGREKAAASLYRNLYPPVPTSKMKVTDSAKRSPSQAAAENPNSAAKDEDWDKWFGTDDTDKSQVNQNLDIVGEGDKELLSYVKNAKAAPQEKVNLDLDIRKAPDKELMQYLQGGEAAAKPLIPAENAKAGKENLNICPACGYLNFEGNTECDFCGAKLK